MREPRDPVAWGVFGVLCLLAAGAYVIVRGANDAARADRAREACAPDLVMEYSAHFAVCASLHGPELRRVNAP